MMQLRPVSSGEEQDIEKLLKSDLPVLYTEFGQEIGILAPGEDAESQAKKWINARKQQLYNLICVQGGYCAFIANHRNAREVEIVAALGDILATAFGMLPVYTLATLLLKSSLGAFCQCDSEG